MGAPPPQERVDLSIKILCCLCMMKIKPCLVPLLTLLGLLLNSVGSVFAEEKQWQVYDGYQPEGYGRHIVFVSGEEEYRSEEVLTALAKIMAVRHGFKCTVLYTQDPEKPGFVNTKAENIPGLEALRTADLMVSGIRLGASPKKQTGEIMEYLLSGRPSVNLSSASLEKEGEDTYQFTGGRKGRMFSSSVEPSSGIKDEAKRREIVNGIFWCLGMEVPEKTDVTFVDPFQPGKSGERKISDFDLQSPIYEPGGEPHGEPSAPYHDVTKGRDGHGYDFADHPVNRHRVYNFHRRQAAHYLQPGNEVPAILAYAPELDGNVFGHWGKFHKNG